MDNPRLTPPPHTTPSASTSVQPLLFTLLSADGEEGEEPLDERQLSKVDPLLGLLHMDLLPRIAFVLGHARAPGAVAPLLCVLIRCGSGSCREVRCNGVLGTGFVLHLIPQRRCKGVRQQGHTICHACSCNAAGPASISPSARLLRPHHRCCMAGKDVVDQVLLCPGMCAALQQVLDASPPGHNAGTQQWQGVQGPGAESVHAWLICGCAHHHMHASLRPVGSHPLSICLAWLLQ